MCRLSPSRLIPKNCFQSLLVQDPQWAAPRLLHLPDNYNTIFQYYHRKSCSSCNKTPKDPALCLVCGAFVCLKGHCCKQQGVCECVLVSISLTLPVLCLNGLHPDPDDKSVCLNPLAFPTLWSSDGDLPSDKRVGHHYHPRASLLSVGVCVSGRTWRRGSRPTVRSHTLEPSIEIAVLFTKFQPTLKVQ